MTDARELFRWMVVARTLGTTLCALDVRWFPVDGEEAVHVGSFADLRPDVDATSSVVLRASAIRGPTGPAIR